MEITLVYHSKISLTQLASIIYILIRGKTIFIGSNAIE